MAWSVLRSGLGLGYRKQPAQRPTQQRPGPIWCIEGARLQRAFGCAVLSAARLVARGNQRFQRLGLVRKVFARHPGQIGDRVAVSLERHIDLAKRIGNACSLSASVGCGHPWPEKHQQANGQQTQSLASMGGFHAEIDVP